MFPHRVPMDRDTPSPEPLVYLFNHLFMHVCRNPQKGALLHTYGEKHKVTAHAAPRRRKAYILWRAAWFPKGMELVLLYVVKLASVRLLLKSIITY